MNKVYRISQTREEKIKLSNVLINSYIKSFFNDLSKDNDNKGIAVLFRFKNSEHEYRTLGCLQRFNIDKESIDKYIVFISNILSYKDDDYVSLEVKEIIFSYSIIDNKKDYVYNPNNIETIKTNINIKNDYLVHSHHKLPIGFYLMNMVIY